jgi:NAD(P)-dependent dehydrogenase (short-subunit alcohol dehydrogenase family)
MTRAVLVAGGTGALGGGVLRALLDGGYPVTATWVVDEERERVDAEFGEHDALSLVKADLLDPAGATAAVGAVDDLGAIVNLVGGWAGGQKAHEIEPEDFDRILELNLRPIFLLARAGIPRLVEAGGGAFVGVSARAADRPGPGQAAYNTAKAGVVAFIRSLDADYRDAGVRANAVMPSVIDTPANRAAMPDSDHSKWVPPEQIGAVIRFLVSDDSAPTSGAAIPVYGRA